MYYVLDVDNQAVRVTVEVWAAWFEHVENRIVAKTEALPGVVVSTVFLGLDHAFNGGPPVLWETLVFDDYEEGNMMWRYTSHAAAMQGHDDACELVRAMVAQRADTKPC